MRILAFVLAIGLAVTGLLVPGGSPATAQDSGPRAISAAPANHGVLTAGSSLVVTGSVRNDSELTLPVSTATVHVGSAPFTNEKTLGEWFAGTSTAAVGEALGTAEIRMLDPGEVATFSIAVPASALSLGPAGAYALEVRVDDASAYTAVTWRPRATSPDRLLMMWPLTVPPTSTGLLDADTLVSYTAETGILTRQLDQLGSPDIAVGIDPMIIASIRALGTSVPDSVAEWMLRLEQLPNDTFALAYADANPAIAAERDVLNPLSFRLDPALFGPEGEGPQPTQDPATVVPTPEQLVEWNHTVDGLAWPALGTVTADVLPALSETGHDTVVVAASDTEAPRGASALVSLGDVNGLMASELLAQLLGEAVSAPTESTWSQTMAKLVAASSVSAHGNTAVAAFGRITDATTLRLAPTLDALATLPWFDPVSLSDVLTGTGTVATIDADPLSAERTARINSLLSAESEVATFSTALLDPTQLTGPRRLALLALLGNGWYSDMAGWGEATAGYLSDCNDILGAVQVEPSSTINILSDNGPLPVTVSNALAHPVKVYINARTDRAILTVLEPRVELVVEANSQAKAFIPVQTVANGEVTTVVTIRSQSGVELGSPLTLDLNIQAGWETAATVIVGVLVVLVFIAGIWRTILKRRAVRDKVAVTGPADAAPASRTAQEGDAL